MPEENEILSQCVRCLTLCCPSDCQFQTADAPAAIAGGRTIYISLNLVRTSLLLGSCRRFAVAVVVAVAVALAVAVAAAVAVALAVAVAVAVAVVLAGTCPGCGLGIAVVVVVVLASPGH